MVKSGKAMGVVLVRLSLGGSVKAKRASPPERDLEQEPRKSACGMGRDIGDPKRKRKPSASTAVREAKQAAGREPLSAACEKTMGPADTKVVS